MSSVRFAVALLLGLLGAWILAPLSLRLVQVVVTALANHRSGALLRCAAIALVLFALSVLVLPQTPTGLVARAVVTVVWAGMIFPVFGVLVALTQSELIYLLPNGLHRASYVGFVLADIYNVFYVSDDLSPPSRSYPPISGSDAFLIVAPTLVLTLLVCQSMMHAALLRWREAQSN